MLQRDGSEGSGLPPELRKDGQNNMNGKEMTQKKAKAPLASYSIWYRVTLVIMVLTAVCYGVALVGWITSHTASLFFGIEGLFLEDAMQTPYLWLYLNYFGIVSCALVAGLAVYYIFVSLSDKESAFLKIRSLMGLVIGSVWAVPLFHGIADLAATAMRVRTILSYDIFDLGMNFIPSLVVTALALVIIFINSKLGEVPADAEIE